ncbi:hypothetical protein [Microbacterium sp.]|uniref:hypothetical protein n=1 Tax=Microbacterium sp. TaxID=51671 RepID=UPI0028127C88|nr:hypothetical protein [Microbacterium sp.]
MARSIGDEAIKPLLRALDDTPVHVKQLAEMFRKHGSKQHRNTSEVQNLDSPDVVHPLKDGWKKDGPTPNQVVDAGKGNRPDPEDYLDKDYIQQHLAQFENGATRIYRTNSLLDWGPGNNQVPGNTTNTAYVFPTDQLNNLMDQVNSPKELAEALGLPTDFFEGGDVQLRDFGPDELAGLRVPSGNEGGTDVEHWIPGGYLPSGIPEAVIDIPHDATGWRNGDGVLDQSRWPGSWRELNL